MPPTYKFINQLLREENAKLRERVESLDDAIRDMLDFATGYCPPSSDKEKLEAIEEIGNNVLSSFAPKQEEEA